MATFTVTSAGTTGYGTLLNAIFQANANVFDADTIVFDPSLKGQTIVLDSGPLLIKSGMTINGDVDGDGKADITISGDHASRIITIADNSAGKRVDVTLSSLTLTAGDSDEGTGVYAKTYNGGGAHITITNTTISDCKADYGGGALYLGHGKVVIANSLITGNHTGYYGAIRANANTTIINTTISDNTSGETAAAILSEFGKVTLINSTVVNNHAESGTGAIVTSGGLTIINSVVAGNTSTDANTAADVSGSIDAADHSFFGSTVTITSDIGSINGGGSPLLGNLADNGGPVLTYAPLPGCPLIDAGSSTSLPKDNQDLDSDGNTTETLPVDATGGPRQEGSSVDIGAVESTNIVVTTDKDSINATDGVISLREAVRLANGAGGAANITFDDSLAGATIVLKKGELKLTAGMTIDGDVNGDNKADIAISGNGASRIINAVPGSGTVTLLSLTLTNGHIDAGYGGAIYHRGGGLVVADSTIQNSTGGGGGIYSGYGTLTVLNSLVTGNTSTYRGGGLYAFFDSAITIINSTFHGNQASAAGGGVSILGYGTTSIFSSTITENRGTGLSIEVGATVQIYNSVIAGNMDPTATTTSDVGGQPIALAFGNVFGATPVITSGSGNQFDITDLKLGELLDNGGTVLSRSPLDGSVLLEAGINGKLPRGIYDLDGDGNEAERLPLDGRYVLRILGSRSDVGAVEHLKNETIIGTTGDNHIFGGQGADRLFGMAGADELSGGAGKDRLDGGLGVDTLTGGATADKFVLSSHTGDHDIITDFHITNDKLVITAADFGGGLTAGRLDATQFVMNATGEAGDGDDRFIYDTSTNLLIYDSNGSADGGSSLIAVFSSAVALSADLFIIV